MPNVNIVAGEGKLTSERMELLRQHIEALKKYEQRLTLVDNTNNTLFWKAVTDGFSLLDFYPADLANALGVSRATVSRWVNGISAPPPMARPLVFQWLRRRAARDRQRLEKTPDKSKQPRIHEPRNASKYRSTPRKKHSPSDRQTSKRSLKETAW